MAYTLSISEVTRNETDNNTFSVTIENDDVTASQNVDYVITGVSASDLGLSDLEGTFNLSLAQDRGPANDYLTDTVSFTIREDTTTEGLERFALSLKDEPTIVVRLDITDTSIGSASDAGITVVKEEVRSEYFDNGTFEITISGGDYSNGDSLPFFIAGDAADYITPASGSFSFSGGSASRTFTKNIDPTSRQGDLFFDLRFSNDESAIQFPIYRERLPVSYELVPSKSKVTEGETVTFTLFTTGIEQGTTIGYTNYGYTSGTGNFSIGADGTATAAVAITSNTAAGDAEYLMLRLDNGQASSKVMIIDDDFDLTVPTLNFPNIGASNEQDQESGFQAIIEELAHLRKLPQGTDHALSEIASSLQLVASSLSQANAQMAQSLKGVTDGLVDMRQEVSEIKEQITKRGVVTKSPYSDFYLAQGFKSAILDGGIMRKDDRTPDDDSVRDLLSRIDAKPDQELKGEALKYMRNILAQAKAALGDLE